MERREFFKSLITGGITVKSKPSKNLKKHQDIKLYSGPMQIPDWVITNLISHPILYRTQDRHYCMRYQNIKEVWLFRTAIPQHGQMVGEIIKTQKSKYRIHCWSAATRGKYKTVDELIQLYENPIHPRKL